MTNPRVQSPQSSSLTGFAISCGESHRARVDDGAGALLGTLLRQIMAGAAEKRCSCAATNLPAWCAVDRDRRNGYGRLRRERVSPTRCFRKRMTQDWETSVKNDRMSASSM